MAIRAQGGKGFPWQGIQGVNPLRVPPWNAQGPHQTDYRPGRPSVPGGDVLGAGRSTDKVPPGWGPEQQGHYPFRQWEKDVRLWESCTSVEAQRRGPLLIQQMTGVAKAMLTEDFHGPNHAAYIQGGLIPDPNNQGGQIRLTGPSFVVWMTGSRFREDHQHMTMVISQEYMNFQRVYGETVDEAMTRYDMLHIRAIQNGLEERNSTRRALQLLQAFRVPQSMLPMLLQHTGGQIPQDDNQIAIMRNLLIQWSRVLEPNHPSGIFTTAGVQGHRQQGFTHFAEAPFVGMVGGFHAGPSQSGLNTGPVFGDGSAFNLPGGASGSGYDYAGPFTPAAPAFMSADGASGSGTARCELCSHEAYPYFGDEMYGDSDTDEEDGYQDPDTDITTLLSQTGGDSQQVNRLGETLYEQYWVAKRKWRRFAKRGTRMKRFHKRRFAKGFQQRQRFLCECCAAMSDADLAQQSDAFFGKGKGKGAGVRKNPNGADGNPLKCSVCNSETHLRRFCPQNRGKGGGGCPKGSGFRPQQGAMYVDMTTHDQRMNFFVGQEDDDMPGPEPRQLIIPQIVTPEGLETSQIMPPFTGPDGQLHELGLYHYTQPIDHHCTPPTPPRAGSPPLQLTDAMTADRNPVPSIPGSPMEWPIYELASGSGTVPQYDIAAANWLRMMPQSVPDGAPGSGPPGMQVNNTYHIHMTAQDQESSLSDLPTQTQSAAPDLRSRPLTTMQWTSPVVDRSNALQRAEAYRRGAFGDVQPVIPGGESFVTWTIDKKQMNEDKNKPAVYSSGTRLSDGREGLLVDCGAYDNLMGSRWRDRQGSNANEAGLSMKVTTNHHSSIRGVGQGESTASTVVEMPIGIPNHGTGTFTGPVLDNSDIPALLGLRTMEEKYGILDMRPNERCLWFADDARDLKIVPREGAKVQRHQLIQAPSGHLLLPCSDFKQRPAKTHHAFEASQV